MIRLKKLLTENLNEAPQAEDLVTKDQLLETITKNLTIFNRAKIIDSNNKKLNLIRFQYTKSEIVNGIETYKFEAIGDSLFFKKDEVLTLDQGDSDNYKKKIAKYAKQGEALANVLQLVQQVKSKITDDGQGGDPYVYFVLGKKQAPDFMVDNVVMQIYFPGSKIQSRGRIRVVTGGDLEVLDKKTGEYRKAKGRP